MKIKRFISFGSALLLSLGSLLALSSPSAFAAAPYTCTWTGAGTDSNFSTAANWSGCNSAAPVPTDNDNLVFDNTSLTQDATPNNDLTNLAIGSISFQGTGVGNHSFTIQGNAITLNGNVTNNSNSFGHLGTNITLGADSTISGSEGVDIGTSSATSITIGSHGLNISGTRAAISSTLHGSGAITVSGVSGDLVLTSASNDFTGSITISGASDLQALEAASLGSSSGIAVGVTSELEFSTNTSGTVSVDVPISLNGNGGTSYPALQIGYGPSTTTISLTHVTLTTDSTFNAFGTADQTTKLTNAVLNGHILKAMDGSQGQLIVNGQTVPANLSTTTIDSTNASNYAGYTDQSPFEIQDNQAYDVKVDVHGTAMKVDKGAQLTLDGGTVGDTTILSGGLLNGIGTTGTLAVNSGGTVSPGHSPGCINSGNLTLNGTYTQEIGGTTACTGYDQLNVTGTVDITNATLNASLINGFKPAKGQTYAIINNDGSDAVTGTFTGLAEGATINLSGYVFKISYKGGDGNDVVLTVQSVPNSPDTGFTLLSANPVATMFGTLMAAGSIAFLARKYAKVSKR